MSAIKGVGLQIRLLAFAVLLAALALACGESGNGTVTPSAESPTLAVSPKVSEVPERTGVVELDAIIEGFMLHDTKTLLPHLRYSVLPCGVEQGMGGSPPCRPDQSPGTPVEVMPFSGCEFGYYRPHEFALILAEVVQDSLYGVYRATPDVRFPGEYVIVLFRESVDPEMEPPVIAIEVSVDEGRIVGVNATCFLTPEEAVEMHGLGEPLFLPDSP